MPKLIFADFPLRLHQCAIATPAANYPDSKRSLLIRWVEAGHKEQGKDHKCRRGSSRWRRARTVGQAQCQLVNGTTGQRWAWP